MDFVDLKTIYTILHLFGVVLGAGGAFVSDGIFISTIKDERITKTELRFIEVGGRMVWVGVGILLLSGALLVSTDVAGYLASSKFLVKMAIVGVIILNGIFIHRVLRPCLEEHQGELLSESPLFTLHAPQLVLGGVISMVSWISTIILGSLRGIPYTFTEGMIFYVAALLLGFIFALFFHRKLLDALWKK